MPSTDDARAVDAIAFQLGQVVLNLAQLDRNLLVVLQVVRLHHLQRRLPHGLRFRARRLRRRLRRRFHLCAACRLRLSRLLVLPRRLTSEAFYRTLEVLTAIARLRLPLDAARLEGALDLVWVGQRRLERRAIVRVADAL